MTINIPSIKLMVKPINPSIGMSKTSYPTSLIITREEPTSKAAMIIDMDIHIPILSLFLPILFLLLFHFQIRSNHI